MYYCLDLIIYSINVTLKFLTFSVKFCRAEKVGCPLSTNVFLHLADFEPIRLTVVEQKQFCHRAMQYSECM